MLPAWRTTFSLPPILLVFSKSPSAEIYNSLPHSSLRSTVRLLVTISSLLGLRPLSPSPFTSMSPLELLNFILPSAQLVTLPVEMITLSVLINPKPLTLMPLALAITTLALLPATSRYPFRVLALELVTSFKITLAPLPARNILRSM